MGTAAAGTRSRAKAAAGSEGGSTPRILQDLRWKIHADDDGDGDGGEELAAACTPLLQRGRWLLWDGVAGMGIHSRGVPGWQQLAEPPCWKMLRARISPTRARNLEEKEQRSASGCAPHHRTSLVL